MIPKNFTLSFAERNSPAWHKIEQYLNHRLDQVRKKNDNPLSAEETATLRGEIAALKSLLALGVLPILPPDDGNDRPDAERLGIVRSNGRAN